MAEYITVQRQDGTQHRVSRKMFGSTYRSLGFTEVEGTETMTVEADAPTADQVSTTPQPDTESTLTTDVIANGPEPAKTKPKEPRRRGTRKREAAR